MQWDEILPLVVRRSFVALVIIQGLIPIFSCRSSCIFQWGGAAGTHLCVCRAVGLLPALWTASHLLLVSSAVPAGDDLAPVLQEIKVMVVLVGEWQMVQSLCWALGLFLEQDLCTVSAGTAEGTCDASVVQLWLCQDTFQQQPGRNQSPVAGINELMLTQAKWTFVKGV